MHSTWVSEMAKENNKEGLVDGCFLTWVQVTEHYSNEGSITDKTKNFRKKQEP
jgi:hypothetical protein